MQVRNGEMFEESGNYDKQRIAIANRVSLTSKIIYGKNRVRSLSYKINI